MKTQFTPAPWEIDIDETNGVAKYYIRETQGAEHGAEQDANAALIATAPELYALLARSYRACSFNHIPELKREVNALLKRARGEK